MEKNRLSGDPFVFGINLLSSRKAETYTRHHFGDADSGRTADADAAMDQCCCVICFAAAWKNKILGQHVISISRSGKRVRLSASFLGQVA